MTSAPSQSSILLFVVGMHRSGTSALAASLHDCGATVGDALLPAQDAVNEDGFFEDVRVIAINEKILSSLGWTWYAPGAPGEFNWESRELNSALNEIESLVQSGFGGGQVQLVKDPRFCITLPIWLFVCERLGVNSRVCTIDRPMDAVAHSLNKRDGFPLSYGRWLCSTYRQHQSANAPEDAAHTSFEKLLENPNACVQAIIDALQLPLDVGMGQLDAVIRKDLNHSGASGSVADDAVVVSADMVREFAKAFVDRGQELTRIADKHTYALSVIDERDAELAEKVDQLQSIGEAHGRALSTIDERDEQLLQAHEKIQELGEAHGYAISVVEERDRMLAELRSQIENMHHETGELGLLKKKVDRLSRIPLVGFLFRRYFNRE